jgi:pyruvate dehydrogenase E1 component alpha subunit
MLLELITYRVAAHTNSDDPTRYIPEEELAAWKARDPIDQFRARLTGDGQWDDAEHGALVAAVEARLERIIDAAFAHAVDPVSAFDHRNADGDARLLRQRDELAARLTSEPVPEENGVSWRP